MVERVEPGAADVHTGAFAYGFEPFEDLDLVRGVVAVGGGRGGVLIAHVVCFCRVRPCVDRECIWV